MLHRRSEVGSVDDDKWRWSKWISPHIGSKPIRDVTPDDIENIRDALSAAVITYEAAGSLKGEGRLSPKSAQNIWAALTTPFKYASTPKGPRELRVRRDLGNPCTDIPPPRDGESKQRHWLKPNQFAKMIRCKRVTREWRDAYAVLLYLHLRPGELHELRVKDLDFASGEVRINRAFDERSKTVTTPKTNEGIRTVTIPATLVPLLERIARDSDDDDRVCPIVAGTPEKERAKIFREHLQCADVDEPAFFVETATHLPSTSVLAATRASRGASCSVSAPRSSSAKQDTSTSPRRSGTRRKCRTSEGGTASRSLPCLTTSSSRHPATRSDERSDQKRSL